MFTNGNSVGCDSTATLHLTINPNANAGIVTGATPLSIGASTTYTSSGDAGGTWSSSNPAAATVDPSTGSVTAISAGSSLITYTVNVGCNSPVSASQSVTVNQGTNCNTTCSIIAIPANNTYTGGVSTKIYIGYGPQSVTLNVTAPASGAPYTYS